MNFLNIFDMFDFFQIFVTSRNTETSIKSNFWLGMYIPYILNTTRTLFAHPWSKRFTNLFRYCCDIALGSIFLTKF